MPDSGPPSAHMLLSGWGRYPVVESLAYRPEKHADLMAAATLSDAGPVLARGWGRSYGDAALNRRGATILTERLNRMLQFDEDAGVLTCEAGLSLDAILHTFIPRGYFLPGTPGTRFVTVGGSLACDIHGKNHHRDGSFVNFVRGFRLLLAGGSLVTCSRSQNADLFWATAGGMGLTGIITEVTLELRRIETSYIRLHSIKSRDLDETFRLFNEHEPNYEYSVAWVDCLASGGSLGRGILLFGNHARLDDLSERQRLEPLHPPAQSALTIPFDMSSGLLNRWTAHLFNAVYYGRQPAGSVYSVVDSESYFYPLDVLQAWNRAYGPRGFVQYQCVFPPETSAPGLVKLLERWSQSGHGAFLAVLKRFGRQEGWLSFPMPGYTLTLDVPITAGLFPLLDELDRLVIEHGGRLYLAKDARLSPAAFRSMYPQLHDWLEVKHRIDPGNHFASALSDRLEIGFS